MQPNFGKSVLMSGVKQLNFTISVLLLLITILITVRLVGASASGVFKHDKNSFSKNMFYI